MAGPRNQQIAIDPLAEKRAAVENLELDARYHEARFRVAKAKFDTDSLRANIKNKE